MGRFSFLAWLLWGATVALTLTALVLTRLNHLTPDRYFAEFIIATITGALAFASVGALITTRQPGNRIGWLFIVTGISFAVLVTLQQYTRYALVTRPGSVPGGEMLAWLNLWVWIPQTAMYLLYLPLIFPAGRLPSPKWRWSVWCAVAAAALLALSVAISPGAVDNSLREVENPFVPGWSAAALPWLRPLSALLVLVSLAAATAAALGRIRGAQGVERTQMRIFAFGSLVLALSFLIPMLVYYPNFTQETFLSGILLAVSIPTLPIAVGLAVLRYRLYEIEGLIRGTLVYSLLSFLLVAGYLVGVVLLQALIMAVSGQSSGLAVAGSTLLMALLFQPLRARIQKVIDRFFYRQKYDPAQVLAQFSSAVRSEVDLDRLAGMLVEQVEETMQPQNVSLWLVRRGDETGPQRKI